MEKLFWNKPTAPVNIIVEYYSEIAYKGESYTFMIHATHKPNSFLLDEVEVTLWNETDLPEGHTKESFIDLIEQQVKSWVPVAIDYKFIENESEKIPSVPEGMEDRLYTMDDKGDTMFTLSDILQRFLADQDEELLSPIGVYNLFMLEVGGELPRELSVNIQRIA